MHYRNGKEAQLGDLVLNTQVFGETSGQQSVGILTTGTPNATACNGGFLPLVSRHKSALGWSPWLPVNAPSNWSITISDCDKIDGLPEPAAQPVAEAETKEAVPAA
jgi:hypothetical protein